MGPNPSIRTVDLRTGVVVAFAQHGDRTGPAVILLHAWGESMRCFDRLVPHIPRSAHVLAFDQRGHGDSAKPDDGYDLDSLGQDVEAFMDRFGLASAVIVGSSSGGYVAQQVAMRCPERVDGLVLVGSPSTLRGRPEFADELAQLRDPIDPAWARRLVDAIPLRTAVPRWYLEDRVSDAARIPAEVWKVSFAGLTSSPAPIETGAIRAPTLIVWGDRDDVLTREDQLALQSAIPDSQLLAYEGVGHLVLWERPERVAADLTHFLLTHPPSR